jgi:hypothetical protein
LFILAALAVVVAAGALSPWSRDRTTALASGSGDGASKTQAAKDPKQAEPWPARPDDGLFTLNLTVRMPDGSPAAGASVMSLSQWLEQVPSARTDAAGRVTIRAIFAPGCSIHASSADGNHQAILKESAAEVRTAFAKPVELVLAPAIDHQVLVTSDEKPVAEAQVVAEGNGFHVTGTTGRDGVATLKLPADERLIGVCAWHADLGVAGVWQRDEKPRQAETVLSLHPPAPLTIRVVDAQNKVVPELDICVSSVGAEEQKDFKEGLMIVTQRLGAARVRTNEQGETSVPWAPRGKLNYVNVEMMGTDWKIDEIDQMTASERLVTVHVHRLKPVTGRLIMPEGTSAEGLLITGWGSGTGSQGDIPEVRARRDGSFVIDAASNHRYILGLLDREWACEPWTGTILKSDDDDPAELVLVAHRATPLTVRVTRGANREPVPGAWIDFHQSKDYQWVDANGKKHDASGSFGGWLKADADGVAHGGISTGTVTIRVLLGGWDETKTLEVTSDEPLHVEFHGNRKAIARMTRDGAAYQPSEKLKVHAWTYRTANRPPRIHQPIVRDDQAIEVNFDEEHLSLLAVDPEQGLSGFCKVEPEGDAAQLVMQPAATYSGTMIDGNGKPLAGRTLRLGLELVGSSPDVVERQRTDASGKFRFTGVAVGVPLHVFSTNDDVQPAYYGFGRALFEPGEVREGDQLKVGTSAAAPRPLAERLKNTCENVRVAGMHAVVVLQGDDSKSVIQLTNRVLAESDDADSDEADSDDSDDDDSPVYNYLPITVTAQQVEVDSAFLKAQNWPRPKGNEVVLIAVNGQQQTLATETISAGDAESAKRRGEEFLTRHKPEFEDARDKLAKSREQAQRDGRRVWVIIGGPRCGPCFQLARWIDQHHAMLEKDYVIVKVMEGLQPHADEINDEIGGANHGVPWFVITEPDGKILVTSEGPLGNMGMPGTVEDFRHLRKMLEQTSRKLSAEEIAELVQSLSPRR